MIDIKSRITTIEEKEKKKEAKDALKQNEEDRSDDDEDSDDGDSKLDSDSDESLDSGDELGFVKKPRNQGSDSEDDVFASDDSGQDES